MSGDNGDNGDGFLEELDESEGLDPHDTRVLIDDEGNEETYVLLAVFELEGQDYAVLTPADEVDEEVIEYYPLRYDVDEEGNESFAGIDDDAVYDKVVAFCHTLIAASD